MQTPLPGTTEPVMYQYFPAGPSEPLAIPESGIDPEAKIGRPAPYMVLVQTLLDVNCFIRLLWLFEYFLEGNFVSGSYVSSYLIVFCCSLLKMKTIGFNFELCSHSHVMIFPWMAWVLLLTHCNCSNNLQTGWVISPLEWMSILVSIVLKILAGVPGHEIESYLLNCFHGKYLDSEYKQIRWLLPWWTIQDFSWIFLLVCDVAAYEEERDEMAAGISQAPITKVLIWLCYFEFIYCALKTWDLQAIAMVELSAMLFVSMFSVGVPCSYKHNAVNLAFP